MTFQMHFQMHLSRKYGIVIAKVTDVNKIAFPLCQNMVRMQQKSMWTQVSARVLILILYFCR